MCGINGFTKEDTVLIKKMNDATRHRGPDGTGVWVDSGVSFGHNRLAIIDLSERGAQPMSLLEHQLTITYNGELYNFKELRKELEDVHTFVSETDTEVILAAYLKWGTEAFNRFNGIFAFAIWDGRTKKLVLARDRAGIKPLYYAWHDNVFIFSSEIKAILEHPISRTINYDALSLYLRLAYVPAPYTLFASVFKFPAGHYGVVHDSDLRTTAFNPLTSLTIDNSFTKRARMLTNIIDDAVAQQLVSDRPVGVYLSGGIDSSVVLDAMSRVQNRIETFSVNFEYEVAEQANKYNADANLAKETAKHYHTTHHAIGVTNSDMFDLLEDMVWHMDEPTGSATALPMMALARHTKEHVAVVLSGDGGDELFGGYERYRISRLLEYVDRLSPTLKAIMPFQRVRNVSNEGHERFAQFLFQKNTTLNKYAIDERLRENSSTYFQKFFSNDIFRFPEEFMYADESSILVDGALVRADKMAMASGLEQRIPLLDNSVVAYAHSLPLSDKVTPFITKRILKYAYRDRIPSSLLNQPKRGWFAPGGMWLKEEKFFNFARQVFSGEYAEVTAELFDWEAVQALLEQHRVGSGYFYIPLWSLLTLQLWARKFNVVA